MGETTNDICPRCQGYLCAVGTCRVCQYPADRMAETEKARAIVDNLSSDQIKAVLSLLELRKESSSGREYVLARLPYTEHTQTYVCPVD